MRIPRIRRMSAVAMTVVGLIMMSAGARGDEPRLWKDASGKFSIKARLVSAEGGKVVLEREDGTEVEIELKKLCEADRKYVADQEEAGNPFKPASPKAKDPFRPKARTKAGAGRARAGETKAISPDWSKARVVIAASDGAEWKVEVPEAAAAAPETRPVGLPPKTNFFEGAKGLVVSADGKKALAGYAWDEPKPMGTTRVVLCDLEAGQQAASASTSGLMAPLALSDDGAKVLMRRDDFGFGNADRLELWGVSESGIARELSFVPHGDVNGGDRDVKWAAFVAGGRVLTRSEGGKIALWDIDAARPLYALDAKGGGVPALSPDRALLAFTTGKELGILDVAKGRVIASRETPNVPFSALAFSPSGKTLALVGMDKLWTYDVASGTPLREMLLTGLHVGAKVRWAGETHVLVGDHALIDVENQVRLWTYNGNDAAEAVGPTTLFLVGGATDRAGAIIPARLPHPAAQAALKRAMADPDFVVLKPGTAVRVDVSGVTDAGRKADVARALGDALRKNEAQGGTSGAIDLVATTEVGKDREVTYHRFGSIGARTYKVREYISRVKFVYAGKTAWETASYNIPHFAHLKEGQTVEAFLKEQEKPDFDFFSRVELPKFLTKPGQGPTLGRSDVTASGVR